MDEIRDAFVKAYNGYEVYFHCDDGESLDDAMAEFRALEEALTGEHPVDGEKNETL